MSEKDPQAFRTISEVSAQLDVPQHILRFWETRFPQLKPLKRAGNRRYYRPADIAFAATLQQLLHRDGLTVKGVQKLIAEHGVAGVIAMAEAGIAPVASPSDATPPAAVSAAEPVPAAIPGDVVTRLVAIRDRLAAALAA